MKKLFALTLSFFVSLMSHFAIAQEDSQKLYFYKLNIQNANEMLNGYIEPDLVSIRAAAAVHDSQPEACIDLRKLMLMNYRNEPGVLINGDIGILFNQKLNDATKSSIVANICQNTVSTGTCSVRFTEEIYDIDELAIYDQAPREEGHFTPEPLIHSLQGRQMLPNFSSACETGQYEDSFEFAASTAEAKQYLVSAGVVLRDKNVIGLRKSDGTRIFDFGHPRQKR